MFENKISKRILEESLGERRPTEKPRNRWEGEVLSEVAKLFIREIWRTGRGSDRGTRTGEVMARKRTAEL